MPLINSLEVILPNRSKLPVKLEVKGPEKSIPLVVDKLPVIFKLPVILAEPVKLFREPLAPCGPMLPLGP